MNERGLMNFIGPQRDPCKPYVCTCYKPKEFHWCPSGRSFVNYHKYKSWGDWPLKEMKEKSFKPYYETEEGYMWPGHGGAKYDWFNQKKGFYPIEDHMNDWKHNVLVGTMKLCMLLEKWHRQHCKVKDHPDGELANTLKRKWDELNEEQWSG